MAAENSRLRTASKALSPPGRGLGEGDKQQAPITLTRLRPAVRLRLTGSPLPSPSRERVRSEDSAYAIALRENGGPLPRSARYAGRDRGDVSTFSTGPGNCRPRQWFPAFAGKVPIGRQRGHPAQSRRVMDHPVMPGAIRLGAKSLRQNGAGTPGRAQKSDQPSISAFNSRITSAEAASINAYSASALSRSPRA